MGTGHPRRPAGCGREERNSRAHRRFRYDASRTLSPRPSGAGECPATTRCGPFDGRLSGIILFSLLLPLFAAAAGPVISVENSPVFVTNMQNYWFYVRIDNVTKLFAYSLTVQYDPAAIDVNLVASDDFLASQGSGTASFISTSTPGTITVDESVLGTNSVTTPGGRLFSVRFKAKSANVAIKVPVTFTLCLMRDEMNNPITSGTLPGAIYLFHSYARVKLFLEGAYTSNAMHTNLRDQDFVAQRSSPYAQDPFDFGAQLPAGVVDWVLVEARSGATGAILCSKSCFLKSNGEVVYPSAGANDDIPLPLAPGTYSLIVRHRNHLDIQTSAGVSISYSPATTYDFTSSATAAYGTNAQKALAGGHYGMYVGDASGDEYVNNATESALIWNKRDTAGYLNADMSMDGYVNNATERFYVWNNRDKSSQVP